MVKSYEIQALVSCSSQSTSKGGHQTVATFLTTDGDRVVLKWDGHTVAKLRRHLQNALLPRSVTENAA